jgi:hypothetical protein
VSISAEYRSLSQKLIVAFLERNRKHHRLGALGAADESVPRGPPPGAQRGPANLTDLDDVSTFISEIESDQKGVPILLKQYLKLDGRLLSYNVDPTSPTCSTSSSCRPAPHAEKGAAALHGPRQHAALPRVPRRNGTVPFFLQRRGLGLGPVFWGDNKPLLSPAARPSFRCERMRGDNNACYHPKKQALGQVPRLL